MSTTQKLENGEIDATSLVGEIPYVGPWLQNQLNQVHIHTIGDFVQYFNGKTLTYISERLTLLLQNARPNQCVPATGSKAERFLEINGERDLRYVRYQIGEVNSRAYNSLLQILIFAKKTANRGSFGDIVRLKQLPKPQEPRGVQTSFCSCIGRQTTCQRFGTSCKWDSENAACVPRSESRGFIGAGGYKGQNTKQAPRSNPKRGLYAKNWKQPEDTYRRLPLPAPPNPANNRRLRRIRSLGDRDNGNSENSDQDNHREEETKESNENKEQIESDEDEQKNEEKEEHEENEENEEKKEGEEDEEKKEEKKGDREHNENYLLDPSDSKRSGPTKRTTQHHNSSIRRKTRQNKKRDSRSKSKVK